MSPQSAKKAPAKKASKKPEKSEKKEPVKKAPAKTAPAKKAPAKKKASRPAMSTVEDVADVRGSGVSVRRFPSNHGVAVARSQWS